MTTSDATERKASALEGGCACGKVRYRMTAAPMFVHCCHCLNCQKHTGSAFVINMIVETSRVERRGLEPQGTVMPLNGGSPNTIFRCPECGVAVWSDYGNRPQILFLRAGTLDDPRAVSPDVHIYTRSKLPWVRLPEGVPAFEEFYDRKALWPAEAMQRFKAALGK
jgi:hypothetical protein